MVVFDRIGRPNFTIPFVFNVNLFEKDVFIADCEQLIRVQPKRGKVYTETYVLLYHCKNSWFSRCRYTRKICRPVRKNVIRATFPHFFNDKSRDSFPNAKRRPFCYKLHSPNRKRTTVEGTVRPPLSKIIGRPMSGATVSGNPSRVHIFV